MNHTPGPWTQSVKNGRIVMSGEVKVATAERSAGSGSTAWDNARIISAAPDLLAACKATLLLLRENGHTHEAPKQAPDYDILDQFDTGLSSPISAVLGSAIAKAEGRTP